MDHLVQSDRGGRACSSLFRDARAPLTPNITDWMSYVSGDINCVCSCAARITSYFRPRPGRCFPYATEHARELSQHAEPEGGAPF